MQTMEYFMVSDENLQRQWRRCTLIGLINQIYFSIHALLYSIAALWIMVTCILYFFTSNSRNDQLFLVFLVYTGMPFDCVYLIIPILIFACILVKLCIKMIYVNKGLTSTEIPENGNVLRSWLRWHFSYFVIFCVLCPIQIYVFIFVIIELYIVKDFSTSLGVSTGRYYGF